MEERFDFRMRKFMEGEQSELFKDILVQSESIDAYSSISNCVKNGAVAALWGPKG